MPLIAIVSNCLDEDLNGPYAFEVDEECASGQPVFSKEHVDRSKLFLFEQYNGHGKFLLNVILRQFGVQRLQYYLETWVIAQELDDNQSSNILAFAAKINDCLPKQWHLFIDSAWMCLPEMKVEFTGIDAGVEWIDDTIEDPSEDGERNESTLKK